MILENNIYDIYFLILKKTAYKKQCSSLSESVEVSLLSSSLSAPFARDSYDIFHSTSRKGGANFSISSLSSC